MNNKATNDKLLEAASQLEKAASMITELKNGKRNLEIENAKLRLSIVANQRSKRASELAEQMFDKDMISKGDVLNKAKEIMGYNDEAFEILKKTVDKAVGSSSNQSSFREDVTELQKEASQTYNRSRASKNLVADKINNM